jgi:hypothetical protein
LLTDTIVGDEIAEVLIQLDERHNAADCRSYDGVLGIDLVFDGHAGFFRNRAIDLAFGSSASGFVLHFTGASVY